MTASTEHLARRMYEAPENLPDSVRVLPLNAAQEPEEWRLWARCRGMNPALFFHPDGERGHARARRAEYAKAICAECPVVQECRTYSLDRNERFGVWGGVSEEERDAILENPRDRNRHRASRFTPDRTSTPAEVKHHVITSTPPGDRSEVRNPTSSMHHIGATARDSVPRS